VDADSSHTDAAAFVEIFESYFDVVYGYVASHGSRSDADEIASQTFLVAFENRGRFDSRRGSRKAWLLGIATNLIREQARRKRRESPFPDEVRPLGFEAAVETDGSLAGVLRDELGALPFVDREALLRHVWGELSYAEVAMALSVPVGTVRSRIFRARHILKPRLEAHQRLIDKGESRA
jgi:RNA polymerase sigma factor (sigma-70 family)